MLVAAFRATLEEVIEADLILHVRDVSHADAEAQSLDVEQVLRQLGIAPDDGARLVEVWNKIDRLDRDAGIRLRNRAERQPVRATSGAGFGAERGRHRPPGDGDRGAARDAAGDA
jgi:GTP-binding protein HflX